MTIATVNGIEIGQIRNGYLFIGHWGKAVETGIKPIILKTGKKTYSTTFTSTTHNAAEIDAKRHIKVGIEDNTNFLEINGKVIVFGNLKRPVVMSIEDARSEWRSTSETGGFCNV